ncbi:MAG: hypothetical protein ACOCXH_02685 [Cyclobacteriaceae bacterium]
MNQKNFFLIIALLLNLTLHGCNEKTEIENFDSEAWKADKNGCKQKRIEMMPRLEKLIFELKGLKEAQLQDVLGKADKTELYERGQRFLIYDISPDPTCNANYQGRQQDLILRLNALGIVSEANLQDYEEFDTNQ